MDSDGSAVVQEQRQEHQQHDHGDQQQEHEDPMLEARLRGMLDAEKEHYPGASTWARDEERLFEILFLRQDLPLLPSYWAMDFRALPMVDSIFQASPKYPPIVYAHSNDYHATTALTRLIDVTSNARTKCQSGLRRDAPVLIKETIERYLSWAAEDGGYQNTRYVPNMMVATVDDDMKEDGITSFMQRHMHALARLQREFLKEPRDADFWNVGGKQARRQRRARHLRSSRNKVFSGHARLIRKYMLDDDDDDDDNGAASGSQSTGEDRSAPDESVTDAAGDDMALDDVAEDKNRPISRSPCTRVGEELADMDLSDQYSPAQDHEAALAGPHARQDSPSKTFEPLRLDEPANPEPVTRYRRQPPVVYGLFILHTTIFLVTLDSAKGEAADANYHVDMLLTRVDQSVWNALTIAIAVCLARDELMARIDDFEPLDLAEESDPDA
ncbi:hypothetical protein G6O67_000556 [Ophiocordyceps sinensis]|uniref:Uncharacterized protein n=1 Tax=Ophiocordyceps sinensis TaxID=72228 RepID=A0A8H4PZ74_9HYPO|nr:hypothetical protein G6O67_000556 [Ophiocordyceps sinensis]